MNAVIKLWCHDGRWTRMLCRSAALDPLPEVQTGKVQLPAADPRCARVVATKTQPASETSSLGHVDHDRLPRLRSRMVDHPDAGEKRSQVMSDFSWWLRYQADVHAWRFRRWLPGGRSYIDHQPISGRGSRKISEPKRSSVPLSSELD